MSQVNILPQQKHIPKDLAPTKDHAPKKIMPKWQIEDYVSKENHASN